MKDMLENYVLGALACIVMGIALIINPHIITDVLNTAIGVILIIWAVCGIMRFIVSRAKERENASVFSLLGNIVLLGAGIYVFVNTSLLETIVMLALGLYLLCSGIPKTITAVKIRKLDQSRWLLPFVTSLLTAVFGLVILIHPTKVSGTFMRVIGVFLTAAGVLNFIGGFTGTRIYSELEKQVRYSGGRGRDPRDTTEEDKANAIDIDAD